MGLDCCSSCLIMQKYNSIFLVVPLLNLVYLSAGQTGTRCTPVPDRPSCVCNSPDGIIDLTKIASSDGTPR